jgi:hypothetical protein
MKESMDHHGINNADDIHEVKKCFIELGFDWMKLSSKRTLIFSQSLNFFKALSREY